MNPAEMQVFDEIIRLKREGLLGEIVAEHTLEMLGNEITKDRLEFTSGMLKVLGDMFLKTSDKIKEAV